MRLMRSLSELSGSIAALACRHARWVLATAALVTGLSGWYAANHFRIDTDLDSVLDAQLTWRVQAAQLEESFPTLGEDITVIIDGLTPELAEKGAAALEQALRSSAGAFNAVERVNGGAFFAKEGLLYASTAEVKEATQGLIAAQPLLAQIAADPSIRGLLHSVQLGLVAASDPRSSKAMQQAAFSIRDVLRHAGDREPKYLSWRGLVGEDQARQEDWRQFIRVVPRLNYGSTSPALAATRAIRRAAGQLGLDPAHGVRVRLTGSSVIADEELATLAESSGVIAGLMLLCMLVVLFVAARSARVVAAILLTTAMGAVMTCAAGLASVGQFTLISIAFLPLFAGLGIDFCIQFHARASGQAAGMPLVERLSAAARSVGGALILAALAIAVAFFAFLPTSYRGVSELGLIAGIGILLALLLSLTVLPALLVVMRAPVRDERAPGYLFALDAVTARRHGTVLLAGLVLALAAAAVLPRIQVNFDPMVLRNPRTEAVSAYYELARHAETTPNTVSAVVTDIAAASALAQRLRQLPQVGSVSTVRTLVPEEQAAKLALIGDARDLLDLSLNPFTTMDEPTDAQIIAVLKSTATAFRAFADGGPELRDELAALADDLDRLSKASPVERARTVELLMAGLSTALAQIRASLTAEPVEIATLPDDLRRQWLSPDGTARIEIAPANPLLDSASTARFVAAVRSVIPTVAGDAVTIVESRETILGAFKWAGILSAGSIAVLLAMALRSTKAVAVTLLPILLAGLLTFGSCAALGIAINLENLIALPLLLGIGVAFNIYCVAVWSAGSPVLLASSLGRGIVFSALTTGTSFATLLFSSHPGTSSMGALLLISLGWILITSLLVTPALIARGRRRAGPVRVGSQIGANS